MTKISIIIPLQEHINAFTDIKACLESIKQQTYREIEVILVNKSTSAELVELCEEYTSLDSRFKIINQEYATINEARNLGLQHITGDYVLFVNASDLLLPTMVEKSINIAQKTDSDIVIFEWLNKTAKGMIASPITSKIRNFHQALLGDILYNRQPAYVWNKLFSKKLWHTVKFNALEKAEDTDTIKAICQRASNIFYLPQALYVNSSLALPTSAGASKQNVLTSCKLATLLLLSHVKLLTE